MFVSLPHHALLRLAIFLSFTALIVSQAFAQVTPAGRVTVVIGEVQAIADDGNVRRLGRGDAVFEGDTLRSGPGGRAQVRFTDRGMLSLRPDTQLLIDDYDFDEAAPAAARQVLNLDRGGFRAQTGRIADGNREGYRVQTPLGVVGIRGTIFDVHQEPGGVLLVGASQGGVEVVSFTGEVGRIGIGEPFDYLRVNLDGSIDYLLESPEVFTRSPDFEAPQSTGIEGPDAGASETSSVATGAGAAENTEGYDPAAGPRFLLRLDGAEIDRSVSLSTEGSGEQPFVAPPAQLDLAALLEDDRVGFALGIPRLVVGEDGEVVAGESGLFGGIATVNSPMLALDGSQTGFAQGIAGTDRQTSIDNATIFLLGDSAEIDFDEDVAGVPGLVWERYVGPVTLFLDPADREQVLEVDRDLLFALGRPTDIAELEGRLDYEVTAFEVVGSGLPIAGVLGTGTLDIAAGDYAGNLEILFGEGETVLFADFQSAVNGGVLEGIEFETLRLFDSLADSSEDAEGTLAGFFTGDAAAFLQLAFDFRVPSRDDADVSGLALLEQVPPVEAPGLDGLTPEEADALSAGFVYVGVSCCGAESAEPPQVYAGLASDPGPNQGQEVLLGIALDEDGERVGPLDSAFLAFPPALVVRGADGGIQNYQPGFEVEGAESVNALVLDADGLPVRAFLTEDGDVDRLLGESIFLLTGMPAATANLVGLRRYELAQLVDVFAVATDPSGEDTFLELFEQQLAFTVNLADGQVSSGFFSGQADDVDETVLLGFQVRFDGQVGFENDNSLVEFEIDNAFIVDFRAGDGGVGFNVDPDRVELGGFFTGESGEAFAAAFKIDSEFGGGFFGEEEETSRFRLFGTGLLTQQDLTLSVAEESALTDPGLFFLGTTGFEPGALLVGRAAMATGDVARASVLGLTTDGSGGLLKPRDIGFFDSSSRLLRPGTARILNNPRVGRSPSSFGSSDTRFQRWSPVDGEPLLVDAESGEILETLSSQLFFINATPTSLPASGFTTFAGSRLTDSLQIDPQRTTAIGGEFHQQGTASFSLDLDTGQLSAGQLFVVSRRGGFGGLEFDEQELGWEVFFDGQLVNTDDGSFIEVTALDGSFDGTLPLDLEASRIEGFFVGDSQRQLNAAFLLRTISDQEGNFEAASGVFTVGNTLLPETRLTAEDVATWVRVGPDDIARPGIGLAAFSAPPFADVPGQGLLLGRAGSAGADGDFVLGANSLRLFGSEGEIVADTRRGSFLAQPFDFVLRQGPAFEIFELSNDDVRPEESSPEFAGFEVSWGAWEDVGSDTSPRVQDDPSDSGSTREVGPEVFFASVNPTPVAQIPRSGIGLFDGPAALLGGGGGDLSGGGRTEIGLRELSFRLDFATGTISEGRLQAEYSASVDALWTAEFDGFLNGAITDLSLTSIELQIANDGPFGAPLIGDYSSSNLTGVLTGPNAERHAGGFSFQFVDEMAESFESVEGLFVIDRVNP